MTDEKRPKLVVITHGGRGLAVAVTQLLIQEQRAAARMAEEHRRRLAEGYTWDGMDGYEKTEKPDG